MMRKWARVEDGIIHELIETDMPIATLFHHSLAWWDVSDCDDVGIGWTWNGVQALAPDPVLPAARQMPSLAELECRLTALQHEIALLRL